MLPVPRCLNLMKVVLKPCVVADPWRTSSRTMSPTTHFGILDEHAVGGRWYGVERSRSWDFS